MGGADDADAVHKESRSWSVICESIDLWSCEGASSVVAVTEIGAARGDLRSRVSAG